MNRGEIGERGVTAITVAITLLLLIGISALALDLAAGWNERRQDQTAADLSAVAGALSVGDADALADQIMATARTNVDTQYLDADWTALWTACTDPDQPAGFTPVNHSTLGALDCISLNPSFVRVRLPDQLVHTSFGRVIGVGNITTSADTIVTLMNPSGSGALPFAIRGDAGAGVICLDTSPSADPPCENNEKGSFGNIAPPLFGNEDMNTSPECQHQTSANNHVAESIAMGIDHFLHKYTPAQWSATGWDPDDNTSNNSVDAVTSMDECSENGGPLATAADGNPITGVYVDTGNSTKADITEGMVTGTNFQDGDDALLTRSGDRRHVDGYDLDNQPLWQHLLNYGADDENGDAVYYDGSVAPASCDPDASIIGPSIEEKNAQMLTCLQDYQIGMFAVQVFDDSILESPRVGTAPRLWHNNLGSGLSYRPIRSFDVVYINALFFDDKDDTIFYPDDDDNSDITMNKWKDVEQVTAFLLLDSMLSDRVHKALGGVANDTFEPTIYE